MIRLYDPASKEIMKTADEASDFRANRIEEIRNFALKANIKRIGIAHCITFSGEANTLESYFSNDFDVYTVDCKYGSLSKQELLGGSSRRTLCNPAGQANYLNSHSTELNISMGLCVGHDMIFNQKTNAPVTCLFDKDFTTNNNTAQAINEIEGKRVYRQQ